MTQKVKKWGQRYQMPTPAKWRKIGDSLLMMGVSILGYEAYFQSHSWLIQGAAVMCILGKFITNFATEEPKAE